MLYLYLDRNKVKLLSVKKTLLGQYESAFYEKSHSIDLMSEGEMTANTDLLASSIKEATSTLPPNIKEKDTCLILPQSVFQYMRTEVPADIAPTAIASFVKDKARTILTKDIESYHYDFLLQDNEKQKQIVFYAMDKDLLKTYQEALSLVDLQLVSIIPEPLAYFKLFEKTLRKDKRENILYVLYNHTETAGYLFDSYGPLGDQWREGTIEGAAIEEFLHNKASEYESQGKKLNRIILAGENSETVRQDTFTKNVGVWTNPLKRIIPHFYEDYLKIFVMPSDKTLPLLQYDVCIGAFIFALENKSFSLLKKKFGSSFSAPSISRPSFSIPKKEIGIFAASFALSFLVFIGITKFDAGSILSKNPLAAKPTATPTPIPPTPTPTVAVDRKTLKVKILNGSGVKGKATEVKDLMKEKGYEDLLTGNADNFDYETTEIQVKKGKENLAEAMKSDIKDSVPAPKVSELGEKEASDIVLIFGKDFK